jgi:hypothetical protein
MFLLCLPELYNLVITVFHSARPENYFSFAGSSIKGSKAEERQEM